MTTAPAPAPAAAPARLHLSENPYGASPLALAAARDAIDLTEIYPDPARQSPTAALAAHLGVAEEQIAVANGSDELVLLTALALGDVTRPGVTTAGTFPGYRICLETARRGCTEIPLAGTETDAERFAEALAGAGIGYLCNPHNPTGALLSRERFDLLVAAAERTGTPLVVDEAYLEFTPAGTPQLRDYLDRGAPVVSLRTFSKAYGLAALRIGYAVGRADLIARLREAQGTMPFSVNRAAQAGAVAALTDPEHLARAVRRNAERRERFRADLAARGRRSLPSVTNFVAVAVPDSAAAEHLLAERYGILVRDAGRFGLPGYLRVSLGPDEQLDRLLDALDELAPVR
ncbi:pyridoxal phosphate-dependent aminotransferase [Streptomyces rubellomurinus]|uniref:histidinol-phosphate transaminase n=1 Tax=Streptomyces rubellomurinus (strain ATCC 31215) TaxID=359131 RepID=A0A0F2TDR7_STRR3|nr:histidinol-phosphate transaminase [Streptomyces rubellomurinus]KJS61299.1 histidinol-phosphate aminotransferase [Streptomyces rubellomurinus]